MKLAIPDIPNDSGDPSDWLCRADELGFLLSPVDGALEKFRSGIEEMRQEFHFELPADEPELPPDAAELPPGVREAADRIVFDLYGMFVPPYHQSRLLTQLKSESPGMPFLITCALIASAFDSSIGSYE